MCPGKQGLCLSGAEGAELNNLYWMSGVPVSWASGVSGKENLHTFPVQRGTLTSAVQFRDHRIDLRWCHVTPQGQGLRFKLRVCGTAARRRMSKASEVWGSQCSTWTGSRTRRRRARLLKFTQESSSSFRKSPLSQFSGI